MSIQTNTTAAFVPPWCEHGTRPDCSLLSEGGGGIYSWERIVSAAVRIAREDRIEDGRLLPGEATIHVDHQDPLDPVAALRLAAELLAAAELAARAFPQVVAPPGQVFFSQ
jgi:hypothetical protein